MPLYKKKLIEPSRVYRSKRANCARRGSVLVEFLLVFPTFLVLSLFAVEVGFMWTDRHITRLAAFAAARVYAAANMPVYDQYGMKHTNPCEEPGISKRAKQAALRKIAIVSPPLSMFLHRLGATAMSQSIDRLTATLPGPMRRILARWPTAAISTEIGCQYDPNRGSVDVSVIYHRMLQTPFIDRIAFLIYQLSKINHSSPSAHSPGLRLDENFMTIKAEGDSLATTSKMREQLLHTLSTIKRQTLPIAQASRLLLDVPGVEAIFRTIPHTPLDVRQALDVTNSTTQAALTTMSKLAVAVSQQTVVLTSLVNAVPSALWRIPITVKVALQRDPFTQQADSDPIAGHGSLPAPREQAWLGQMRGSMSLGSHADMKDYRHWGHAMSRQHTDLSEGAVAIGER